MSSLAEATSRDQLAAAWKHLLTKDRQDGELAPGVIRFEADAEAHLDRLFDELVSQTYVPASLTEILIPKGDGTSRTLRIPPVRDRVVERCLLGPVIAAVEPWLGPSSFAYRAGLGVAAATQELARFRDEGYGWVLRADIHDCFPDISAESVLRQLRALLSDRQLLDLIGKMLTRTALRPGERIARAVRGLPQGSALSPMLANLALEDFDLAMRRAGFPLVRYADDMAILADSAADAWEAAREATRILEGMGMTLGSDKTHVMSFEEGFTFLGEEFGPRYPPALLQKVDLPDRKTLYLGVAGSWARLDQGRIRCSKGEAELLDVPAGLVSRIVCFGPVGISAGLRSWALSAGVDMVFCSQRGNYLGHCASNNSRNVDRLRRQVKLSIDEQTSLVTAKIIIASKVRKQAVLMQKFMRRDSADELRSSELQMEGFARMIPDALSRDELMGLEGAAARCYFQGMGHIVPTEFGFVGRTRRPPLDVVNSALSYGYAILVSECVSALAAAGLDPALGILHADDVGRPSLALDLAEEFRPMIVDQVVLDLVGRRRLRPEHGRVDDRKGGILLTKAGREAFVDAYERRMLQRTKGALPDFAGSLRRHLYRQAQVLASLVEGNAVEYVGLAWRP